MGDHARWTDVPFAVFSCRGGEDSSNPRRSNASGCRVRRFQISRSLSLKQRARVYPTDWLAASPSRAVVDAGTHRLRRTRPRRCTVQWIWGSRGPGRHWLGAGTWTWSTSRTGVQGYGRTIVDCLIEIAKSQSIETIFVESYVENRVFLLIFLFLSCMLSFDLDLVKYQSCLIFKVSSRRSCSCQQASPFM